MRTHLTRATVLACLAAAAFTTACGASVGGGGSKPTISTIPVSDFCERGKDLTAQIKVLDRNKPEYLDEVKRIFRTFGTAAPEDIADDITAYVGYVQGVTSADQLAPEAQPADMTVTTDRIDAWWKRNCGGESFGT